MSVKLLEFDPDGMLKPIEDEKKEKKNIFAMIQNDAWYGCTPDLPRLRFSGPQYFFLWDDRQIVANLERMGLDHPNDIQTHQFTAFTKDEFLPMRNIIGTSGPRCFLIPDNTWVNQVRPLDSGAFTSVTPKKVSGKILSVSLKAIQCLDTWYCNRIMFDRIRMPIVNPRLNQTVYAWTYVNKINQVFKYDPHQMKYKASSTQDMHPLSVSCLYDQQVFDGSINNEGNLGSYNRKMEGDIAV